jgi:hypothetical protein
VIAVPCLLASNAVSFTYSESAANLAADAQVKTDGEIIDEAFGESQVWAIMVPEGDWADEADLVRRPAEPRHDEVRPRTGTRSRAPRCPTSSAAPRAR